MTEFFRFPSTPHLAWLSENPAPRDDKLLAPADARDLLAGQVVVQEKIDGANLGISLSDDGVLRIQNRGQYLTAPYVGQFARLTDWLSRHERPLHKLIGSNLILFGEWCAARHSIGYDRLPDWLLMFDVYDRRSGKFWSSNRRDALAETLGLATVPTLLQEITNLGRLERLLAERSSRYQKGPMEGVVVRRETVDWCTSRAKLVSANFTQAIGEHWSRRRIEWNRVDWSKG